eukprot:4176590-Amphidinium_carterae.1
MQPQSQGPVPGYGIQAGVPHYGITGNPLDPLRPVTPGVNPSTQGVNPLTGQGYGYDPPTPMMTPAMASQGTPSHFSISTPPHPQQQYGAGGLQGPNPNVNPLSVDPMTEVDPWGRYTPGQYAGMITGAASTIGSVGPPGLGLSH